MRDETMKLATSRCMFGHRWTMWERGSAVLDGGKSGIIQARACVRCGKAQVEANQL